MTTRLSFWCVAAAAVAVGGALSAEQGGAAADVRLMTLDPGHFHAALIQKEMYPGVAPRVHVYAPLGWDLLEHLNRVAGFNRRAERPTSWELDVHTSPDYFERMLKERPGNVVVLSGRNAVKMDRILASVKGGLHVLADKPWILKSADLPKVEAALAEADAKKLVAYDIMTERFEVTTMLQRALVNDRAAFGEIVPGTEAEPSVYMESVHHLMKVVSGAPEHQAAVVLRHQRAGRSGERHRYAPRRPRAVDALPGQGDRLPRRHQGAGRAAVADVDSGSRLPPRDQRPGLSQGARAAWSRTGGSSTTATRSSRTRSRASTRS